MSEKLTVKFEGKDLDLFMSYGLLNELVKLVGSPEVAPTISIDDDLREGVLKAVLAVRKPSGKIVTPVADIDDLDMSITDIEAVLDWSTEAVLSFFVRSLGKMVRQVEANKDVLEGLKSSLAGLEA
ncbi:hypothetical protein [Rhizobium arsenicireducens]